jgi:hypothetical protein
MRESARHSLARKGIKTSTKKPIASLKTKFELVEVLPVAEFNARARREWDKAVDKWREGGRKGGMPFVGMYLYYTDQGAERKTGYVLKYRFAGKERTGSILRATKKEALAEFEKMKQRGY